MKVYAISSSLNDFSWKSGSLQDHLKIKPKQIECYNKPSLLGFITELNMSDLGAVCEAPEIPPKFIQNYRLYF